ARERAPLRRRAWAGCRWWLLRSRARGPRRGRDRLRPGPRAVLLTQAARGPGLAVAQAASAARRAPRRVLVGEHLLAALAQTAGPPRPRHDRPRLWTG